MRLLLPQNAELGYLGSVLAMNCEQLVPQAQTDAQLTFRFQKLEEAEFIY